MRCASPRPAASTVLALSLILSIPGPVTAEDPPPIPSAADRARLITAEQEGHDQWLDLERARAIHDEYDVTHYDLTMALDIPGQVVSGTVEISATAQEPDLTRIDIDLYPSMTVSGATVNGNPAFFIRNGNLVTVNLDGTYQPDEAFTVGVTYSGTPAASGAPFRWMTQDGVPMVLSYSEPYGAPAWWPCKDDPKDKATLDLHLTVPDNLFAVSNGLLESVVNNGNGTATYNWSTGYPMSPYLFSIAVTNYQSWTEVYTALDGITTMDVDYYAYPSDFGDAQISWGRNIEMMEYYASIFGEYPFLDEKYAIAEFHHGGAMEHQTATSMGWGWVVPNQTNDWIVAHELAHSWVGDMITMTEWSHAWCKEGFATHCEALYFEDKFGLDFYHQYMNGLPIWSYAHLQIYDMTPPLHAAIYYKGAWVLHMLRHVVGDQNFFDALMAYTSDPDFRYSVADSDDLRGVFEDVSGMDLVWFFDEWVYGPGYPIYRPVWTSSAAGGGYDIELEITQTQTEGPIFKMPIDVQVETTAGTETFVVWDSLATQAFVLHVDDPVVSVELDPDQWILRQIETVDVQAVPLDGRALLLAQNRPNPFNPATRIDFRLEGSERIRIDVYDTGGRWVKALLDEVRPSGAGFTTWDGTDDGGRSVGAGVYYYRLTAGELALTRRMVLVR